MIRRSVLVAATLLILPACPTSASAEEPLVEQVRKSIDRGTRYLRQQQLADGSWEVSATRGLVVPGGTSCLALLALINAGVPLDDPTVQRGLRYIRELNPRNTYVVGLHTMVLAETNEAKDLNKIQANADWLLDARVYNKIKDRRALMGWGYGKTDGSGDNSNSQYALLGLHAARVAGAHIPREDWEEIRAFYERTQSGTGAWAYKPGGGGGDRLTMTVAGLAGLVITGEELDAGRQQLDLESGVAARCNVYPDNTAIARALNWIDGNFAFELRMHTFYNFYGIERAGRLSGRRFLGELDWYRDGCQILVGKQRNDGSWQKPDGNLGDAWPVVATSFSLLFLSKGRTPVLISKLAYGEDDPLNRRGGHWNNKRSDAQHLVEFAGREVFKNRRMGWQVYDPRKLDLANPAEVQSEVENLLQSPILYMNGHHWLTKENFTPRQRQVVRQYLEEGGFVFGEACCGSQQFFESFREVFEEMFSDSRPKFRPLPPGHPIWSVPFKNVDPSEFPLWGLDVGCKTIVVISEKPMAGYWEEHQFMPDRDGKSAHPRGAMAFRLAGNVIAYATGLEPPKPRLTQVRVADADDRKDIPRSFLKAAQLKHDGDWEPAPRAMRNLMFHVQDVAKLDVSLKKEVLAVTHPDVFNHKFLYMHGRNRFSFVDAELAILRANLETGGVLFADACCGKPEFDASFREFVAQLFPDATFERIPLDDYLFSQELNGSAIRTVKCRRERPGGADPSPEYENVPPFLEGVKVDGRWVVIYSKYDIGCALEKHKGTDCLGHDHESALRIGAAAVLYSLKR